MIHCLYLCKGSIIGSLLRWTILVSLSSRIVVGASHYGNKQMPLSFSNYNNVYPHITFCSAVNRPFLPSWHTHVVTVLRGGSAGAHTTSGRGPLAWLPWGNKNGSPELEYRRLLIEQRSLLEKQLKEAQEELVQLRKEQTALAQQQSTKSVEKKNDAQPTVVVNEQLRREQMRAFRAHITALEEEVRKLEAIKATLEKMLKQEQLKAQLIQAQMDKLRQANADMKEHYENELSKLRKDLQESTNRQLAELKRLMEERMKEALDAAKRAAEREKVNAIEETERRLQQQAAKQLQSEQKKAEQAVEREKVKMRKLVKALAEREKKLLAQAEREAAMNARSLPTSTSTSTTSTTSTTTPPGTVRGPLK